MVVTGYRNPSHFLAEKHSDVEDAQGSHGKNGDFHDRLLPGVGLKCIFANHGNYILHLPYSQQQIPDEGAAGFWGGGGRVGAPFDEMGFFCWLIYMLDVRKGWKYIAIIQIYCGTPFWISKRITTLEEKITGFFNMIPQIAVIVRLLSDRIQFVCCPIFLLFDSHISIHFWHPWSVLLPPPHLRQRRMAVDMWCLSWSVGSGQSRCSPVLSLIALAFCFGDTPFNQNQTFLPAPSKWPFDHPNEGHLTPGKGHLKQPKRSLGRTW